MPEDSGSPILPQEKQALLNIADLTNLEVPKLPEPLFLSHILPILQDTSGHADITNWLRVAGSLNRPIDVIDGTGNVLFRVPALQGTVQTKSERDGRIPISAIQSTAALKRRQSPIAGENYLTHALEKAVPKTKLDLEPILQLNAIFKRYNLPEIQIAHSVEVSHQAEERQIGFTGEYDDL